MYFIHPPLLREFLARVLAESSERIRTWRSPSGRFGPKSRRNCCLAPLY